MRIRIKLPEGLYILAYFVYLAGSAMTLIEHGVEFSLWLMTFAVVITLCTTVLPWLGFSWLRLIKQGCRWGWRLAVFLQFISWGTFATAMFHRLMRDLDRFYIWITLTSVLWAGWLLVFIYSRHACHLDETDDTLRS